MLNRSWSYCSRGWHCWWRLELRNVCTEWFTHIGCCVDALQTGASQFESFSPSSGQIITISIPSPTVAWMLSCSPTNAVKVDDVTVHKFTQHCHLVSFWAILELYGILCYRTLRFAVQSDRRILDIMCRDPRLDHGLSANMMVVINLAEFIQSVQYTVWHWSEYMVLVQLC